MTNVPSPQSCSFTIWPSRFHILSSFLFLRKLRDNVLGIGHLRETPEPHLSTPVKTSLELGRSSYLKIPMSVPQDENQTS